MVPNVGRRRRVLAWLLAAPTIVTALAMIAVEGWRVERPASPLFTEPFVYSLADAIQRDDVRRAHEFIRAGQDPNGLIAVHHPVLTGGRVVLVSPLLWAVAVQSTQNVQMLLGFGARMDHPADKRAACLAETLGNQQIAGLLRTYGDKPSPEPCSKSTQGDAVLASWLASVE